MNGFYAVYYTGVSGWGNAVVVVANGLVTGADAAGGLYDGKLTEDGSGAYTIDVTLVVPAGVALVTGQTLTAPLTQSIKGPLPSTFANGQSVTLQTEMGPVNAIFKKLRDLA